MDRIFRGTGLRSILFTFHYGEIWIKGVEMFIHPNKLFTFHYGEIWMAGVEPARAALIHLHSIMVRFGLRTTPYNISFTCTFTFHYGEIWIWRELFARRVEPDLHSIMVRFGS